MSFRFECVTNVPPKKIFLIVIVLNAFGWFFSSGEDLKPIGLLRHLCGFTNAVVMYHICLYA